MDIHHLLTKDNAVIIFGSSRSNGNTMNAVRDFNQNKDINVIDLSNYNISPFDYNHRNKDDDYIPIMENIITYDNIILATPVYWYSMSSQIKIFIDRFSDLLTIRKDLGKKLKGKNIIVIATYAESPSKAFETPFIEMCNYMNLNYTKCFYYKFED